MNDTVQSCSAATTGPLLPCPFCDGDAHFYKNHIDGEPKWSVSCGCGANLDVCEDTTAEAAAKWNDRPGDPAQAAPKREEIAAIVLGAILGKADGETYGASHARKMNEDRAEKAADRILALSSMDPNAAIPEGCVSVELLQIERATADRLREENARLRLQCSSAGNEVVLEQSEKLDGTTVQTVRASNGVEYQRQLGLTMLELLIQAGYDASLPHPESFKGFSYLKLADILKVPLTTPAPPESSDEPQEAWQPIETAPEKTAVLVCGIGSSGYYVADAKLIDGDWYLYDLEIDSYAWESSNHTHWMPHPAPPSAHSRPHEKTGGAE
jgi:hypothetical protein